MFTGIIEKIGKIESVSPTHDGIRVTADTGYGDLALGESVAFNGVCLTVAEFADSAHGRSVFYLSQETLNRSNLRDLRSGSRVNLERALQAHARLSGHIVQGHVDGLARLSSSRSTGEAHLLEFELPHALARYVVEKGSIALNGVSLTVNGISTTAGGSVIHITLIPHSWENTNFRDLEVGALINVEVDVLAKYVERLCQPYTASKQL